MLAAGASSRMRGGSKLLSEIDGRSIVGTVVSTAMASKADPVVVVVGHRGQEVRERIPGGVIVVENPDHAAGLSTSLAAGLRALPSDVDGTVVLLGDMPLVEPGDVDALIGAFEGGFACVPLVAGRWGNPVLWSRAFFDRMAALEGDRGARRILEDGRDRVVEVPLDNPGLLLDIDTAEDLERARAHG